LPVSAPPGFSAHKTLPDLISSRGPSYAVSIRLRDIVEALEPGIHQFFPIQVLGRDGNPVPLEYVYMLIEQEIDAVIPELTNATWRSYKDEPKAIGYFCR